MSHGGMRAQCGFTLIEVVVALAIFALSMGALYQSFGGALRHSGQIRARELQLLEAQSILAGLRSQPDLANAQRSGRSATGLVWHVEIAPFDTGSNETSPWKAYEVTVRVRDEKAATREVALKSIELARSGS